MGDTNCSQFVDNREFVSMRHDFVHFLALEDSDRLDVFETTANRLDTVASYVEKTSGFV